MKHLFTDHPNEVGETYLEHMRNALRVTYKLAIATNCQLLHAVLPFVKPPCGTDLKSLIKDLSEFLPEERKKKGHLDSSLEDLSSEENAEYEELIDLYKTYGGD